MSGIGGTLDKVPAAPWSLMGVSEHLNDRLAECHELLVVHPAECGVESEEQDTLGHL